MLTLRVQASLICCHCRLEPHLWFWGMVVVLHPHPPMASSEGFPCHGAFVLLWILWVTPILSHLHYHTGLFSSRFVPGHPWSWPICSSFLAVPCLTGNYPLLLLRGHQSQLLWPGAADSPCTYHRGQCAVCHSLVSTPTHHWSWPRGP